MSQYKKVKQVPNYMKELIDEIVKNHYSYIVKSQPYVHISYKDVKDYKRFDKICDLSSFVNNSKIENLIITIYAIYNYNTNEYWVNTKIKISELNKSIRK